MIAKAISSLGGLVTSNHGDVDGRGKGWVEGCGLPNASVGIILGLQGIYKHSMRPDQYTRQVDDARRRSVKVLSRQDSIL